MEFPTALVLNAIIAGLLLGGFYAAVSVGISISFGMLDVVNIAHPAFIILGSYIAYIVNDRMGLDPIAVDVLAEVLREKASTGVPVVFSSHQLDLVERLCDRVGIIRSGQMVACGSVAKLTAQAGSMLVVTAPSAPATWAANLPGVRVVSRHNATVVLELDPGADDQTVLAAALSTGPVTEFRRSRRSLTDLFRDAVNERAIQ